MSKRKNRGDRNANGGLLPVPLNPQTIEQMAARFSDALRGTFGRKATQWSGDGTESDGGTKPGALERCVFDFPIEGDPVKGGGWRLIVSHDLVDLPGEDRRLLHVSLSQNPAAVREATEVWVRTMEDMGWPAGIIINPLLLICGDFEPKLAQGMENVIVTKACVLHAFFEPTDSD